MPVISFSEANAGSSLLPGQLPEAAAHPTLAVPDALDLGAAALRQNNVVSSVYDRIANGGADPQPVANYDALKDLSGFEDYADRFVRSQSPAETQQIKGRITDELSDRSTLARAGWWGLSASIASGSIDPVTLATMAIPVAPEIAMASRAARVGLGVAANVALTGAQEAVLQHNQELRTPGDSLLNIGAGALLTGALGTFATRVPKAEFESARSTLAGQLAGQPDTLSAARVNTTSMADETIAKGGESLANTVGQISPLTRVMTGDSLEARQLVQQLVDTPYVLNKNLEGVATPSSVELRVKQALAQRGHAMVSTFEDAFQDYKQGGGDLSLGDFGDQVAAAMRREDVHEIPQVAEVARQSRAVFNADREALVKLGALPEDVELLGAKSYFPRVYDQYAIQAGRTDFEQRLTQWFTDHPKLDEKTGLPVDREPAEVKAAVADTLDRIQGTVRGTVDLAPVKNPNLLKARSLDVPDHVLEPYLSSDYEHVMHSYFRSVLPQIEMRSTFGSTTLEKELGAISDQFHIQSAAAETNAAKDAVRKNHASVLQDITALRDRVLGNIGPRGNESLQVVRLVHIARAFNYVRLLGGQTLSSLSDYGRLVARYGLTRTAKTTAQFLGSIPANRLIREDAKRMGTALEWTLDTRAQTFAEIGDELAGSRVDKLVHKATQSFTRLSLMATWDASMKAMASSLLQDSLLRGIQGKLSPFAMAKLAKEGIGDAELPRIAAQYAKYGSAEEGLARARTELWDDKDAARLVEQAVMRSADTVAFNVGKGDLPLMMNKELWRTLLQFRSFGMATVNRMMIPVAQGLAHGDIASANGLALMLALGGMTYATKEWTSGRTPDLSAGRLIPEMLNWSGALAYLPDAYDPIAGMFHLPRFSNFKERSLQETVAGPTVGTADTIMQTIKGFTDGHVSAKDIHKLRQLIPFQNVFYLRRIINALEGSTAEAVGADGADRKSFADRVTETAPVEKSK